MKKILLPVVALLLTTSIFAQKKLADVAKFVSETIDFGKIKQGVPAKGTFTVTNISNEPLIIEIDDKEFQSFLKSDAQQKKFLKYIEDYRIKKIPKPKKKGKLPATKKNKK